MNAVGNGIGISRASSMSSGALGLLEPTPSTGPKYALWVTAVVLAFFVFGAAVGHEPSWLDETYSYAMTQHGGHRSAGINQA